MRGLGNAQSSSSASRGSQPIPGLSSVTIGNDVSNIGTTGGASNTNNSLFQINERLTWVKSRHTLKFGASWNYYRMNRYYAGNNGQLGLFEYHGPVHGRHRRRLPARPAEPRRAAGRCRSRGRTSSTARRSTAGDDYKITDNLTLNLALRWGYTSPLVEEDDRQVNVSLVNAEPLFAGQNGNSRALYEPYYNGWEPRLGFAYRSGDKWVFRGGYGITQYMEGTGANLRLPLNPPFFFESQVDYDATSGAGTIATGFEGLQALGSAVGAASCVGSEPPAAVHAAVERVCRVPARIPVFDQHRVRGQLVEVPRDADRGQPAAAGRGRSEHLGAAAEPPAALRVQPADHEHQHDDVAWPFQLQRAADHVQAAHVEGPRLPRELHVRQGAVEQPGLLRLWRRRQRGRVSDEQLRHRAELRPGVLRREAHLLAGRAATSCPSARTAVRQRLEPRASTRSPAAGRRASR